MNSRRYAQMGPPAGVDVTPRKDAAPAFRDPGPPALRADLRRVLAEGLAELEVRLVALLGRENVLVQPLPLRLTEAEFGAQTWAADHRIHLLVPVEKDQG